MPKVTRRDCADSDFEKGCHAIDLDRLARESIRIFFADKKNFFGVPLSPLDLYSDFSIKTVLRTPFDDATFDFIHAHCLTYIPVDPRYTKKAIPFSVYYLLKLLKDMRKKNLPKDFQPGLCLLFFKYCKGLPVPAPPVL